MTITYQRSSATGGTGVSARVNAPSFGSNSGMLLVAAVLSLSNRLITGVSTGWTVRGTISSATETSKLYWRIGDGTSNDNLTATLIASGEYAAIMSSFSCSNGWAAAPIQQYQGNSAIADVSTPYALGTNLSGVAAGQLLAAFGCAGPAYSMTPSIIGTNWTSRASYNLNGGLEAATVGTNNTDTGTPNVPSLQLVGNTGTVHQLIVAMALSELAAPATLPLAGLFFGSP